MAIAAKMNGHRVKSHARRSSQSPYRSTKKPSIINRLAELDREYYEKRKANDPASWYAAGEAGPLNPIPRGINPFGTDASYHNRLEFMHFLIMERGRAAVRNHPLVEQGINRLIANLRLGRETLAVNGGDKVLDADHQQWWHAWKHDPKRCDFEQTRDFGQICRQSFFNQVVDGDIVHLPLVDGSLQTWEAHHQRTPWGYRPTNSDKNGIIHGSEIIEGKVVAYWITPTHLSFSQVVPRAGQARRFPVFDEAGNKITFWIGFTHRFAQYRGISRLSAPRDAMTGFDDLNYAHIKSSLRRALIAYLMESNQLVGPGANLDGQLPQAGDRTATSANGLGLESTVVEQAGEPAQVHKAPLGWKLQGWNANLPGDGFFEHSALLLTMLSVNLDLPLMFLLLDGSLVNFHGGRMTYDQAKLRFEQLQQDQISGLVAPTYEWKTRQRLTPGSVEYDPIFARAVKNGYNPFKYVFRPRGWPYVKPLEDAAGEDLSERRNLQSLKRILAGRGIDEDEHREEVLDGRMAWAEGAIKRAIALKNKYPEAEISVGEFFRELWYGNDASGVKYAIGANMPEPADEPPPRGSKGNTAKTKSGGASGN
jgi:hypothetical protein